jgi:hypothetical protein
MLRTESDLHLAVDGDFQRTALLQAVVESARHLQLQLLVIDT